MAAATEEHPFDSLPEDVVSDIVACLEMKDRAKFGATNRRHSLIETRTGRRKIQYLEITFNGATCRVYMKYDLQSNGQEWVSEMKEVDSEKSSDEPEFWQSASAFLAKASVGKFLLKIERQNKIIVDAAIWILSNIHCGRYEFQLNETDITTLPDLSNVTNLENASVAIYGTYDASNNSVVREYLQNLPRVRKFSFGPLRYSMNMNQVKAVNDEIVADLAEKCQILHTDYNRSSADGIVRLFEIVRQSQDKQLSLQGILDSEYVAYHVELKRRHPEIEIIINQSFMRCDATMRGIENWMVHRQSSTIIVYEESRERMLIAKVPFDKVEDTDYVSNLWLTSYCTPTFTRLF